MNHRLHELQSDPSSFPTQADAVIVGGGVMGLSIAYNLARMGMKNLVVLEASYLCSGASGRNGGGVRAQWSSERNIVLMRESLSLCASFASEMGINVWYRPGGYLFVSRNQDRCNQLSSSIALQNQHGLRTRWIEPSEISEVAPIVNTQGLLGASYNPDDAVVFPWPFVFGYAEQSKRLGVQLFAHTSVDAIERQAGQIQGVQTSRGFVRTSQVICCAGAWSPEIAKMVDVDLPSHAHRHEICSTESVKPFVDPLIGDLDNGLYFSQSARGEIVGGISNAQVPKGLNQESSPRFLSLYAKALLQTAPKLAKLKVLRQWAGCYDITPDGNPLCGEIKEVPGFHLMSGFMGHGFMMAPVMGEKFARHFLHGEERELFHDWSLSRFAEGRTLSEAMILG